jgi:hypothetical protein
MKFINEYRYSPEDTKTVFRAYYMFFNKVKVTHLASLVLCAVCTGLFVSSGLKRFLIFALIFLLIFLFKFVQYIVGARYDAARILEDTGEANPVLHYELGETLEIYRAGKHFISLPLENIAGCKEVPGGLVIFTMGNYNAMFKNDCYLEGGATALKAYLRENGVTVK